MNWTYISAVIAMVSIALLFFWFGWMSGHSAGRKKGFYEGWDDGCDSTAKRMQEEFNRAYPSPFRQRLLDAQRTHPGRQNSAGPIRTHQARLRGDFRLPENNPDKREPIQPQILKHIVDSIRKTKENPPTKFNPNPSEDL